MAYNELLADRIRCILFEKGAAFSEKHMFGGICFMVDDKMCCATHTDKKSSEDLLLCRVGETVSEAILGQEYVIPMEFTGKAMKGYVYIMQNGFKTERKLQHWLQLCLAYNPLAKKSKK